MLIIFSYIAFLGIIKLLTTSKKYNNKIVVIIGGAFIFTVSAFRSISFGPDVIGYVEKYISLSYMSLSELWSNFINGIGKDPFFYLFAKLINTLGANYRVWLTIICGIFCLSVSKQIYRYSDEVYISFVALISLGYLYFSLTGLRQTMALSIILISYKYLREQRVLFFIGLVAVGSLFHSSAIVFLVAYPFSKTKIGWKQGAGITLALIIAYFFSGQLLKFLYYFSMDDRYVYYIENGAALTISGFLIQMFIYLFCLYYKKGVLESDNSNLSLYNLLFLGLVFQAFSIVIAEFFRISIYFSIFSIFLIPKAINTVKDKNIKPIIYLGVLLALVAYVFWTGNFNEFRFFW